MHEERDWKRKTTIKTAQSLSFFPRTDRQTDTERGGKFESLSIDQRAEAVAVVQSLAY